IVRAERLQCFTAGFDNDPVSRALARTLVDRVVSVIETKNISVVAGATVRRIIAETTHQPVVAGSAIKCILATTTDQHVVAAVAVERIVSIHTNDDVVAAAAVERVVAAGAVRARERPVLELQLLDI